MLIAISNDIFERERNSQRCSLPQGSCFSESPLGFDWRTCSSTLFLEPPTIGNIRSARRCMIFYNTTKKLIASDMFLFICVSQCRWLPVARPV